MFFSLSLSTHTHIILSQAEQPASRQQVMAFVQQLFDFVEAALAAGSSVLIHCLAGAHRAGTTGCLLLMHKTGLGADQVRTSRCLRHATHDRDAGPPRPAHDLTYILCYLVTHTDQATRMAQAARPVINPIGGLPKLLRTFETDRRQ